MLAERRVRACLAEHRGMPYASVRTNHGGMNSATWLVESDGRRWVAKAVPEPPELFAAGLEVAAHVQAGGVATGAPEPTATGDLVLAAEGAALALLTWVAGQPLAGADAREQADGLDAGNRARNPARRHGR